ncbi:Pla2g12a [Symbiodinium sp. CCMP2592]|nr:Pla2g12a [Symbiodinium sp. CCMP2592]
MRALTRNEPLERHNLPDSAPGVVVDGAGSTDANGIYVRTGFKVANTEVFQKRGTCLVMLKRGEDLNWSLINLNGLRGKSDKAPKEEAISSGVYTFSPAKLRWNPNSTTLYQVAPSLHSRDNLLPPHVGWTVVDGLSPAPSVNFCTSDSLRPEKLLAAAIPGKLLTRIAETAPTVAKVQTSIHQAWRTDAQQTLPRILRWGTSETSRARKQVKAKGEGRLAQTLSLPDLRSPAALLMPEGETVMVIYSLVIGRPSFHFEWGLSFQEKELRDTGRRIVEAVEPNSPFDRWNIWQMVRGRPEMCVRAGDQLLKQSGAWAYFECPLESSEGYEDLPSITESETLEGVGDTLLVLDFGRFERRPCPPEPPRLEPWEAGYGLRVEIDSSLAGPYQEDVIAWALVLKEDLSEAAFVSTTPGKSETCWRAFDGESGKESLLQREIAVKGGEARLLGLALADVYGTRAKNGLCHAKDYYLELPPVSCSMQKWSELACLAREGAVACCPTAAAFFDGLCEGLGWDVYESLLDFEIYTLELQRRERVQARIRPPTDTSSSSDSSESLVLDASTTEEESEVSGTRPGDTEASEPSGKRKKPHTGRCTGFAIAGDSSKIGGVGDAVLVSQTVDLPGLLYGFGDFDCVLRLQLPDLEVLAYDCDGRFCPVGMNSAGLGVCVFNLHDRQTEGFEKPSVSVQTLVWELLLCGHTLRSALAWLQQLKLPPMCGSGLLLVDASGAATVELNPGGPVIGDVHLKDPVLRANHPILSKSATTFGAGKKARRDSERRLQAVEAELERRKDAAKEQFDGGAAISVLRKAKKVHAVLRDAEVGAIMHNGGPITLHLSEGIKTGRTYAACLAVLTAAGWSAFSYPSRPVHVKQRPGLMDGILSLVLPPEDEQHRRRKHLTGALFYFLPSDLQAGFSAPITTQSTVSEPCELFSTRKLLKLSLVLPHGRPKGLEVSEEGGSTLYVVDEGRTPDAEARVMKISNHAIPWRLCSGDFIVRLNGLSGAERMLEELQHNPPVLALEVLRPVGGKREGETADIFELHPELDEQCQAMVSETRTHGLLSSEAELASLSVGRRDDLIQQVLDGVKSFRRDVAPKRPSDGEPVPEAEGMDNAILLDAQRRVLVLHRFRMMEQTAKEFQGAESGQLSEACRLLQWAMADASFSPEKLGRSIEEFKSCGGTAVRASAPAQVLLKRAIFQMNLWTWRDKLREERKELKRATEQMLHMERVDQEHTKQFPGRPMPKEDVEKIVQARNLLGRKVRQGQSFRQQLQYEMAEAEAVLRRSLRSAAGQQQLSLQEQNARFHPQRTLTVGMQKGWW